jgi:HAE1 family hydrophobic/amphiphilic exporter-1
MCVVGVLVLGWLSLVRLPLELIPAISSSHISVSAPYRSSSPEETERQIVRPLEDILGTVNGIESLTATASAESGNVMLEFASDVDMDLAAVEVRDRVDRIRHLLPDDLEWVRIRRFKSTDIPVLRFQLSAPWPPEQLYRFVEDVLQRRLERIDGVADVSISGLRTSEVQVNLVPDRLAAHGIGVRGLSTVLRENNLAMSGGKIREGSRVFLVRVMGELKTLNQIRDIPVNDQGLRLGDVAEIGLGYPEQTQLSFLNGSEAIGMSIYKASTANMLQVVDLVREEIGKVLAEPGAADVDIVYFFDSSKDVRNGLAELRNTGLLGGALAILFIYLFLRRLRTTLLAAIAIPVSVIMTFVIMYLSRQAGWTDMTLNIMSLMGLMLAIGMLVDSAIVVIESIFRHRQELGADPRSAALNGASEVAMPIAASTLTTACVFMPMIFVSSWGRFSFYLKNIGITIIIVIGASLIVALTVVPMVAALLPEREARRRQPLLERMTEVYTTCLRFTLRHRFSFAMTILVLLVASYFSYMTIGRSFSPPSFQRQLSIQVDTPKSYSLAQKQSLYQQVYKLLDSRRDELEIADITYGFKKGSGRSRGHRGSNRFTLYLKDETEGQLGTGSIRDQVEAMLPTVAGVTFTIGRSMRGRSSGGGVEVELTGDRPEILEVMSEQVAANLAGVPGLRDVDTSLESGDEEIRIRPDPERALQAGLSSQAIGMSVSSALSSRAVTYLRIEDRELDMVVQYRDEDRQTLDQLKKLPVAFGRTPLSIGAVAEFDVTTGARVIEREDRRTSIKITADTETGTPSFMVMGSVQGVLSQLRMPSGYEWSLGSDFRESSREASNAMFMILFALVLIYMIMAALYESFAQPLTIMLSVPFGLIGVGIIMRLVGEPRSRTTDIGLIILAGIVVNNAIVLVDYINRLRRSGMSRDVAVITAGRHRLRPILMTAITTILGLSPMVAPYLLPELFGSLEGRAAYWAPVGLVILGGLTTSTFLTLMIIPTIYSVVDDFTRFIRRIMAAV